MKNRILKTIPWIITVVAIYFAVRDLDWKLLSSHLGNVRYLSIVGAVLLTCISYLLRGYRWKYFFPQVVINFTNSYKILILGFFMNNTLPARAGELVRAHMGAKITGEKRTLVLATIASERLTDGLVLSFLFLAFCIRAIKFKYSGQLLYVAMLFAGIMLGVILVLILRNQIFSLVDKIAGKLNHRASDYALNRLQVFINGLAPLSNFRKLPIIALWSVAIWSVELLVFILVVNAFHLTLPLSHCILFLVTVNFSSLIPAAPGGVGVIEAVTKTILMSIGIPAEMALGMVVTQHIIQYLVVGIPGAAVMLTWKKKIKDLDQEIE